MNTVAVAIELGKKTTYACPCCGNTSETVHGYLYDEMGETAVYFAGRTMGHQARVNLLVSMGQWDDDAIVDDRRTVALSIDSSDISDLYISSPESSPWHGRKTFGKMLSINELSEKQRAQFVSLALSAIKKDPRIEQFITSDCS